MKPFDFKFSTGSLFICSKCGKSFDDPDRAEKLKSDLRGELGKIEATKKIRVMVGSCLGICEDGSQTFAYYPNQGKAEVFTTESDYERSKSDIFNFIKSKLS